MLSQAAVSAVDDPGPGLPLQDGLTRGLARSTRFAALFPILVVNVYPVSVQAMLFEPRAADRTIMHTWFYCVGDAAHAGAPSMTGPAQRRGRSHLPAGAPAMPVTAATRRPTGTGPDFTASSFWSSAGKARSLPPVADTNGRPDASS